MFLQLHDGPEPLNTVENPLYPGPKPYFLNRSPETPPYPALGANGSFDLPKDLYLSSSQGFLSAIQSVVELYRQFQTGAKKNPVDAQKGQFDPGKFMKGPGAAALVSLGLSFLQNLGGVLQALNHVLINQKITGLYNANAYNVQNLNFMNAFQIAQEIQKIDTDLETALAAQDNKEAAALSQFRLIYQQAYEQKVPKVLGIPVVPLALALGAWFLLRKKK